MKALLTMLIAVLALNFSACEKKEGPAEEAGEAIDNAMESEKVVPVPAPAPTPEPVPAPAE